MKLIRPAAVASLLAVAALALGATAVLAECPPGPDDCNLEVGYAFTVEVVEASATVGPGIPDAAPFDWHLELAVDGVYRGGVPDMLVFDGWSAGCNGIRGDQMEAGDRLFILSEHLDPDVLPRDPLWGDLLMWKRDGATWTYHADALGENIEDTWMTGAMRSASTTSVILRIARLHPPDTATDAASTTGAPWSTLIAVFIMSSVAAWRVPRRHRRRTT